MFSRPCRARRLHGGDLRAQPHLGAEAAEQRQACRAVQLAERHGRNTDVRGIFLPEQCGLNHGGGERQRRVVAGDVE
jgi:hypothetical protein